MTIPEYQMQGARFLASRKRALLGDQMRCGKTPQSIIACDLINARSVLVVCPGIARDNWEREWGAFSFFGRPVSVLRGPADKAEPNGVTIVSMDGSRSDAIFAEVMQYRWDVIIIDECQFLKEPTSQRTKLVCSATGFASRAERVYFLSGTPLLNGPQELFVILATIGVYRGSYSAFFARYVDGAIVDGRSIARGMRNVAELKEMLSRVMLRRTFAEVFPDAPKPTWHDVALDPTHTDPADIAALLELENSSAGATLKAVLARVAAGEEVDWATEVPRANFAMLRRLTSIAKIRPAAHWLRTQLASGASDKIVVFAHHSRMVEVLTADLAAFGAVSIYGAKKPADRQRAIDEFRSLPHRRVLVCQDQIARTAIDLTAASDLFFAEMDPVPNNNLQAAFRVQGLRQTRPVRLFVGSLAGSTDEAVTRMNVRKTRMEVELFD